MNDQSVFHLISDITDKKRISCVLIGGFAVNHYRVTRQTADIDFLITKKDFEKIDGLLEKAGYRPISSQENFIQFKSTSISPLDVDFMIVDQDVINKITNEGRELTIAGHRFIVPSLNHLIALKLHSMEPHPGCFALRSKAAGVVPSFTPC